MKKNVYFNVYAAKDILIGVDFIINQGELISTISFDELMNAYGKMNIVFERSMSGETIVLNTTFNEDTVYVEKCKLVGFKKISSWKKSM